MGSSHSKPIYFLLVLITDLKDVVGKANKDQFFLINNAKNGGQY